MGAERRVFLHGWGQDASLWRLFGLATRADDLLLSLPGHGGAEDVAAGLWVDWLEAQLPEEPLHLVGWSLGALLALELAARLPHKVRACTLYAATPCFCSRPDWPHGVTPAQIEAIAASVDGANREAGLTRFRRMMLHGEGGARTTLRRISEQQSGMTPPTAQGLQAGLYLLKTMDLRPKIAHIQQPVRLIHGERDAVIPIAAAKWLADHLPHAEGEWLAGYGHMPWEKYQLQ